MDTASSTASPHGTASRYNNHGCRCKSCRRAWADYITNRRREAGVRPRAMARTGWYLDTAYYPDKTERVIKYRPTGLGLRLLEAAQARTGKDADDIIEDLLRSCSQRLTFHEPTLTSTN